MRRTAGYTWTDYKTSAQIAKELKITLDKLLEYKRSWIQHVNGIYLNINQLDALNFIIIIIIILSQPVHGTATYRCDDTRGCIVQFWPPDDEHMVLETCRGMK